MTTSIGPNTTPASTLSATNNTTSGTANSSSSTSTTGLGSDFNTFLKLLTTQLQNQDPTQPLDTNQMTQQLVSFSQVEQAINENTKLQNLVTLQQTNQGLAATQLVGHVVQVSDSQAMLSDGQAKFGYNLAADAQNTTLTLTDASGNLVYQGAGETASGDHVFSWNGNASDGTTLPDGVYTLSVSARATDQSAITAAVSAYGKVDGVQFNNGQPLIDLNGVSEQLTKVIGITG